MQFMRQVNEKVEEANASTPSATSPPALTPVEGDIEHPAWRYALAMQQGEWDEIIRRTPWMRERLAYVALNDGSETARDQAIAELKQRLGDRNPGSMENHLRAEGVEDQYVFSAAAALRPLALDSGAEGLESPASGRLWIEVVYPTRELALRDENQIPIRRLVAGVNVNADGDILKANTIGNLEIEPETLAYFSMAPSGNQESKP